ncbi:kelch-like protein 10 [Scophthalmus maximus]|uniref:kelch-like protein 10 n=1 Tax=Scophthalmus maximus TaxID=52904 RepID=UPI000F3477A7|nr:kelch-like protein 10 [Scophthalmus maximus]
MLLVFSKIKMSDQHMSPRKSGSVFNELRLEGKFCDAVIQVQDVEFPIHRIILCDCSSYFQALFERWMTTDKKVFNIPGPSPDIMQLIIEFAYTDSVNVTEDNVQDLVLVADMLNVMDLIQACSEFLCERLHSENCIGIWQLTKVCSSSEMQCKAYRYITDHFEEVFLCEEFLLLSVQELNEILGRDDLNVRTESIVYEAILCWIAHIPEERKEHIAVLLSKVRLAPTSLQDVAINVLNNQGVCNNTECKQIGQDALQTILLMERKIRTEGPCNPCIRPRLPNAIMLVSGGSTDSGGIEAYDPRSDVWVKLSNKLKHPLTVHGTAFLEGYFYCIGGFDGVQHLSSVNKLDMSTHTWHEVAPMHNCRSYVSVTVLNGLIYALGGFDGHSHFSSAERYKPETNQWTRIASMRERRRNANCTTLQGKIYICGGSKVLVYLQSAECYNPETNQWTMIAPMISRRSGLGVVAFQDQIYAVGGFTGDEYQRSAESYDPWTDSWQEVCPMLSPRRDFGLEVIEDRIFAVGGFTDLDITNEAEAYCSVTDSWTECPGMKIFRCGLSSCVVYGIPNMADYTFLPDSLSLSHLN